MKNLNFRLLSVALLTTGIALLLVGHADWLNGPEYWKWPWQKLDSSESLPLLLLAVLPFFGGQWFRVRTQVPVVLPLLLIMAASIALQIAALGLQSQPFALDRISRIVEHPTATSYYFDALEVDDLGEWLSTYDDRMLTFHLHSMNKPPGPILYYLLMLELYGDFAALMGGLLIGFIAVLAIPATYRLILVLGGSEDGAFLGASFLALSPGFVLFFPEFDQLYPIITCVLTLSWVTALRKERWRHGIAFGLVLFVLTFFSYGLLVIGAFLMFLTLAFVTEGPRERIWVVISQTSMGLATVVLAYSVLKGMTGFSAVNTFFSALESQKLLAQHLARPYPQTIFFDLTDFAMGTGWISFLLVLFYFHRHKSTSLGNSEVRTGAFCVLQILVVAIAGLIPTETARVWIFLMPLLMFPIGEELSRWSPKASNAVFACLWLLLVLVHQNMVFIMI